MQNEDLLDVRGLKKHFPIQRGFSRRTTGQIKAVDDVDLIIKEGETLGLVGESGCGKSTLGRSIIRLYEPTGGEIYFRQDSGEMVSVTDMDRKTLKAFRRNMQIIFQDPYSSLNPRMTVLEIIGEPLLVNGIAKGKELEHRVLEVLDQVGLSLEHLRRYPHSFSGGQRQRIGIAKALVLRPKLVVADEPVSALDVSIQAQILNLLKDLQAKFGLTYLFISHDLSVIRYVSDRIAVMYVGKIVEIASKNELLANPAHPYTEALLSSIPKADLSGQNNRIVLAGEPPDPANLPSGCVFHQRCPYAQEICRTVEPKLRPLNSGHVVSCHLAESLQLRGHIGMSLLLAGLAFLAAFVLICLCAIWVFQSAIKSRVGGRFKAADEIVNNHQVPEAWLKASRVGRDAGPGAEDKAKALFVRNLDRLIGYFRNCPFVDSEESREVLLQELHAVRASWENWTWVEIRAGGSDEAP